MAKSVEITTTFKCNWTCDYCLVDTHNQPDHPFEKVLEEVNAIEPGTEVTFSGGEPGLLKREQLEQIIKILKDKDCPLDLLTNGLFIRRHEPLLKEFGIVMYHCIQDMNKDIEIEFPDLDQNHIRYTVIAESHNLTDGSLLRVMDKYPHIRFQVFPETRYKRKSNLALFSKFLREHADRLFPNNLYEVSCKITRAWGER